MLGKSTESSWGLIGWKGAPAPSSACAIRKAALTCLLRLRRFFAHILAFSPSACQPPDSYAGINPSSDIRRLNCSVLK